jgi:purine-binding chemotaxis protein CheW
MANNKNDIHEAQEKETLPNNQQKAEVEELAYDETIVQMVGFSIEDVTYGINILSVHEIQRIPEFTRLPNTPNFILGVINLRGSVIPVVDIRLRFGLPTVSATEQSRIIVIEVNAKIIGLQVDNVSQVIRVNEENIDPPSDLLEGVSDKFISGVARMPEGLMVILSLDHILFSEEEEKKIIASKANTIH